MISCHTAQIDLIDGHLSESGCPEDNANGYIDRKIKGQTSMLPGRGLPRRNTGRVGSYNTGYVDSSFEEHRKIE